MTVRKQTAYTKPSDVDYISRISEFAKTISVSRYTSPAARYADKEKQ